MNKNISARWERALAILCHILMLVLAYIVFASVNAQPSSDISIHATWAAEGDFSDLTSFFHHGAHPMWHVLVSILLHLGVPLAVASPLVTAVCKLAEFAIIHWLYRRWLKDAPLWLVTLLTVLCTTVSSLCWPWYNPTVYLGAGTPNTWHSCTQMIALVWMLLCVPYVARIYDRFTELEPKMGAATRLTAKEILLLCFLLLCSLAAKPTVMQVFMPAACLFFLWQWIRHPKNSRYFLQVLAGVVPAILLMILQYMYYFGIIVPSQGDMVLEVSLAKVKQTAIMVVLMQAFPMAALLLTRKQPKDTLYWLTMLMNIVGIIEFLILGENGRRAADGNFGWGLMAAVLMLWVIALPRIINARRSEKQLSPIRRLGYGACWALLLWHLGSGIYYLWYLLSTGAAL